MRRRATGQLSESAASVRQCWSRAPLSSDDSTLPSYGHSRWTDATRTGASAGLGLRGERERCERRRGGWVANLQRVTTDGIACR